MEPCNWNPVVSVAKTYCSYVVGFLFSTVIGHFVTKWIVNSLWRQIGIDPSKGSTSKTVQGYIERFLYTASYFSGHPSLIGLWPALKVASRWKQWSEREGFNIFLTGTGINIIYGVVGAQLIRWLPRGEWEKLVVIVVGVLILSLILQLWIKRQPKKQNEPTQEQ